MTAATTSATLPPEIGHKGAQAAVLACVMHLPLVEAARITAQLQDEDFTVPALRVVLGVVRALALEGVPLEPVLIVDRMRSTGQASCFTADQGPDRVVADLYTSASVPASAGYYVRAIKKSSARRQAQTDGIRTQQGAEGQISGGLADDDLADLLDATAVSMIASARVLRGVAA